MIALSATAGYTAVRWTGATQPIKGLPWLGQIDKIYGVNPVTGIGYVGYTRGDIYPTLTTLTQGLDYLFDVSSDYVLQEGDASLGGSFGAFPGYTPPVTTTPTTPTNAPATGPGFIATATAAQPIIGGTLVARTAAGLVPHSAKDLTLMHLLFGIALNNAAPGGAVGVQRGGYILYPGLGLITGDTLYVGDNGKFVNNNKGLAFSQIVGRAISPDELIYQPESLIILHPFSQQFL